MRPIKRLVCPDPVHPVSMSALRSLRNDSALVEGAYLFRLSPFSARSQVKPLADGIQWLLTNEAWKLAQRRGCMRDYASFAKHAKAHPDRLDTWGLRFLGSNKPGDHRMASFQDLLWIQ